MMMNGLILGLQCTGYYIDPSSSPVCLLSNSLVTTRYALSLLMSGVGNYLH